ncbi:hypothetical protein GXW82_44065 [Streptacidiphilus sp. 4-A2]|nr:hypothetical protein [Streptacidiphilus sp. 4-A2]
MDEFCGFHVRVVVRPEGAAVVVEVFDENDFVFAQDQVVTWTDLGRLAQEYGVPRDRQFVDEDARAFLDAV